MQVQIRQVLLSKRGCSAKIERPVTGFKEDPENDSQIERRCDSFQSRDTVASGAAKARIYSRDQSPLLLGGPFLL
jgi:hypothetical protein